MKSTIKYRMSCCCKIFAMFLFMLYSLSFNVAIAQEDFTNMLHKMDRESLKYTFLYENISGGSKFPFKKYTDFLNPIVKQHQYNCLTAVYKLDKNANCLNCLNLLNSNSKDSFIILKKNEHKKALFTNGFIIDAAFKSNFEKFQYSNNNLNISKKHFDSNGIFRRQDNYYFDTLKRLKIVDQVDENGNVVSRYDYYYNENNQELDSIKEDNKLIFRLLTVPVNPEKRKLHQDIVKYLLNSKFKRLPGIEIISLINKLDAIKHSYTTQEFYKVCLIDYLLEDNILVYVSDFMGGEIIGINGNKKDLVEVEIFDFKKQASLKLKIILGSKGIVNKNSIQLKEYSYSYYNLGDHYDKTTYTCKGCHRYRFKERGMKNIWRDIQRKRTQFDGRKNYITEYDRFLIFK